MVLSIGNPKLCHGSHCGGTLVATMGLERGASRDRAVGRPLFTFEGTIQQESRAVRALSTWRGKWVAVRAFGIAPMTRAAPFSKIAA